MRRSLNEIRQRVRDFAERGDEWWLRDARQLDPEPVVQSAPEAPSAAPPAPPGPEGEALPAPLPEAVPAALDERPSPALEKLRKLIEPRRFEQRWTETHGHRRDDGEGEESDWISVAPRKNSRKRPGKKASSGRRRPVKT